MEMGTVLRKVALTTTGTGLPTWALFSVLTLRLPNKKQFTEIEHFNNIAVYKYSQTK